MIWALFVLIILPAGPVQVLTIPQASEAHCQAARAEVLGNGRYWEAVCGAMPRGGVAL